MFFLDSISPELSSKLENKNRKKQKTEWQILIQKLRSYRELNNRVAKTNPDINQYECFQTEQKCYKPFAVDDVSSQTRKNLKGHGCRYAKTILIQFCWN